MIGTFQTALYDIEDDQCDFLSPMTPVEVVFENDSIRMQLPEDTEKHEDVAFPRTVYMEVDDKDQMRVIIYPFNCEGPLLIEVGMDGEYKITEAT